MIKELNDLVHFIKTSVWRDEALIRYFSNDDPAVVHLYQAIWNNSLDTDEAAAKAAGKGLTAYKILGRKLRTRLRGMAVFFSDEKAKADAATSNYVEGALDMALMQLLHARGYRHAPLALAKRLYRRGVEYEVPAFAAEALRIMKDGALDADGPENRFEAYSNLFWTYRAHADAEERAADYYQWSRTDCFQDTTARQNRHARIRAHLLELEPYKGIVPSFPFHLHYFTLLTEYTLQLHDYEQALLCCDEAIAFFRQKPFPVGAALARFWGFQVTACILLGRFEQGEAAALSALDYAPDGSLYFFRSWELYFYLAMHTAHYELALDIFRTVTLHKRFGNQRPQHREIWHVLGAYLFLIYRLDDRPLPEKGLPAYKSYRFANQTPLAGRDKQGMNAAILIAHALMQLLENREDELPERLLTLDKYRLRYLQDAVAARSDCFIRILGMLPKSRFRPDTFMVKAQPLLEQMTGLPRQLANQARELEVVPYERLTKHIAGYLQRKNKRGAV